MRTSANALPSQFGRDSWSYEESQLLDAQGIPEHVAEQIESVRNPVLLRSEMLFLGKGDVECFVIRGLGKYKSGWSPDTTSEVTFWVEKDTNFVPKIEEHWQGKLIGGDTSDFARTNVEVYPIVEFDNPAVVPELFEFQPPPTATLISTFRQRHPSLSSQRSTLLGTAAPEVEFPFKGRTSRYAKLDAGQTNLD